MASTERVCSTERGLLAIIVAALIFVVVFGCMVAGSSEEERQRVFEAGSRAERAGIYPSANPYSDGEYRIVWLEGWTHSREQRGAHTGSW